MLRIPRSSSDGIRTHREPNKKTTASGGAPAGILLRLQALAGREAPQCCVSLALRATGFGRRGDKKERQPQGLCSCGNFAPLTSSRWARGSAMLRIPRSSSDGIRTQGRQKRETTARAVSLFWCSCGNSNPGHLD